MAHRRILHLVGSPTSTFYRELSELYARGCLDALGGLAGYDFLIAHVSPDGTWRFPASLDDEALASTEPTTFARAVGHIAGLRIDAALPQMFCRQGMTAYRSMLELLGIAYLGNRPLQMGLAADKAKTRALVAAAGVRVPPAELLRRGMSPRLAPPCVVKPNDADNSDGVTLVTTADGYADALAAAFAHADEVLVERYIELGREVRCGVLERGSELACLPLQAYYVDRDDRPIRSQRHKLGGGSGGGSGSGLALTSKTAAESWIVAAGDPVVAPVHEAARHCYQALGCRQYGLFDFRIDPEGRPWFLEAGLYCSFAPHSVLVTMADAAGMPLARFFDESIERLLHPQGALPKPPLTSRAAPGPTPSP